MKKLSLTLFLALICSFGYAQNRSDIVRIDSLRLVLKSQVPDTTKIIIYYQLSDMNIPALEQLELVNKGLTLSKKIDFQYGILEGIFKESFKNNVMGNWAKGLEMALQGIEASKKYNNKFAELSGMSMVAMSYQKQKDYKNMFIWSKRILQKLPPKEEGLIRTNEWAASMMASGCYTIFNQLDSAVYYANRSYQAAIKNKLPTFMYGYSLQALANAFAKQKKYNEAYFQFLKAIEYLQSDRFSVNEVEIDIAKMFMSNNDLANAEKYAQFAFNGTIQIPNPNVRMEACKILAKIYEPQNKEKAYTFLKTYHALKDSLFNQDKYNQIYQIESNEKRKLEETKKEILEVETKSKERIFIIVLCFLAVLASVLGYSFFLKQKANERLQDQKDKVESTLSKLKATQSQLIQSEKLASLGELTAGIAHEIQNPLNFVNNFAELSVELIEEFKAERANSPFEGGQGDVKRDVTYEDEILSDITQNLEKINLHGKRASSIVSGMLEHSRTSTGERVLTDINKLADESLRLSYHGLRAKDKNGSTGRFNADFELIADPNLPKINVIPQDIGRVLLNIINNAFYATNVGEVEPTVELLADVKPPKVIVSTKKTDNSIEIRVTDNGTGMSQATKAKVFQPFFTTKPTGQGTGLGLSLAYDIITKGHGGTIECESVEGEGTTFVVRLPTL